MAQKIFMNHKFSVVLLLILFTIIIRIPLITFQVGIDSYFIYGISNIILEKGFIAYNIHPLSIYGYYPYSYAVGAPLLVSLINRLMDINLDFSASIFSIFTGLVAFSGSFILAGKFKQHVLFKILFSIIYSTSPLVLYWTYNNIAARGLYLALLPWFVFAALNFLEKRSIKNLLLLFILLIISIIVHHLFIINLLLILILIISYYVLKLEKRYLTKINKKYYVTFLFLFAFSLIFIPFIYDPLKMFSWFDNYTIYKNIVNTLILHGRSIGLLPTLFLPIGLIFIATKNRKEFNDIFLIVFILISLITLKYITYSSHFTILVFSLTSTYGIYYFLLRMNKNYTKILSILIVIIIVSNFTLQLWHPNIITNFNSRFGRFITYQDYETIKWINNNLDSNIIGYDVFTAVRYQAFLPCKILNNGVFALSCGYIEKPITKIRDILNPRSWADYPYEVEGGEFFNNLDWRLKNQATNSNKEFIPFIENFNIDYFLKYNIDFGGYTTLANYISLTKEKVYTNGAVEIWLLK